jgi:hypothetical protein
MKRALFTTLLVALVGLAPTTASAFKDGRRFSDPIIPEVTDDPATTDYIEGEPGGGGGRHFTGSRDDGFTCSVCHTGGEVPDVDLQIREFDIDPRELRETGYIPSTTYEVVVAMPRTTESSLTAEFVRDADGRGVGTLLPLGDADLAATEKCLDGTLGTYSSDLPNDRFVFNMRSCGIVQARFTWTAPPEPVGPIWFNAGLVAGNGDGKPTLDGVRIYSQVIPLAGESAEATRATTTCSAAPNAAPSAPSAPGAAGLAFAAALLALARRRPR